jgi:predicted ATPase/class 3 adenylate cyclase
MLAAMNTWSGPALPTGTLTFLFTDVEGSTRLWEAHPQAMRAAMARHDELLTAVFEQHDGVVVRPRGEGDSLFVVFIGATDAVAAALAGQRALAAEDWGAIGPLRVRMGLHIGEADLRDGSYYGSAVNRTARIRGAGHGGQILLSEATVRLVGSALPWGASLQELGRHRLRGLAEPEVIFQLNAPDRPSAFPPLQTRVHQPSNLPLQLTSFIGREYEVTEVMAPLGAVRLVTLTGPGGSGKTRLALQVAARVLDQVDDGVWFVDLSGVADPAGVLPAIAQVLGVTDAAGTSLPVALAAYLRPRQLLLVLDNFEQVLAAALPVYDLLREAPQLTVLVTSRTVLRVAGEREYVVASLPVPAVDLDDAVAALAQNASVQLFVERAQAQAAGFTLSSENAPAVAELCRRLEGLPLAIELAAARVKLLSPPALVARLDRRLSLLSGGVRSLPARQQTLRATIQWSYDLLTPADQALFCRLGVFAGGWTLAAAEAVCSPGGELAVLTGLESLVDQSLVQQTVSTSEPRFTMLATLREFALAQLEASREAVAVQERHAAYLTALAEAANATYWQSGHLLNDLLTPLDADRDNLVVALGWAVEHEAAELGLRLAGALNRWFYVRAPGEGRRWVEQVLALPEAAPPSHAKGLALYSGGISAVAQGDFRAGVVFFEQAVAVLRSLEDLPTLSLALGTLATYLPPDESTQSAAYSAEALALAHKVGGPFAIGWEEMHAANALLLHQGDREVARAHLTSALHVARALDADWLEMLVVSLLAWVARDEGHAAEAISLLEAALPIGERLGVQSHLAMMSTALARLLAEAGDVPRASAAWQRALTLARDLGGNRSMLALGLTGIASLLSARAQADTAVRLLAATATGADWWDPENPSPGYSWFREEHRAAQAAAQAALGEAVFAWAWADGQELSAEAAVALALTAAAALAQTPAHA